MSGYDMARAICKAVGVDPERVVRLSLGIDVKFGPVAMVEVTVLSDPDDHGSIIETLEQYELKPKT